jgi:hypothetical protein
MFILLTSAPSSRSTSTLVRGLVFVFGSLILIWLNAGTRLTCEKATIGTGGVECNLSLRAFNVIPFQETEVHDVRGIERRAGIGGSGDRGWGGAAVDHLIFITDRGTESLGYFADQFASDWQKLDASVKQGQRTELIKEHSTVEFLIAHLAALAAAIYGFRLLWQSANEFRAAADVAVVPGASRPE